ncbi:D-2-hydroxyacid dehydrogenase [Nostocoides sp. Soil756]|uniref:D-2-hydroxyacid dehydrogenase n=1 Tax=Nostocoides sp. Soil756 TaxID=1736399 RepID=UPI0006F6B236|nr:D-2-hydroxyacid dehydrogenase [Tetrasphaera sp. Soil756]KRE63675.1 hypothetical protein ASG78_01960 [Tetrasphaera sp. Soil756]
MSPAPPSTSGQPHGIVRLPAGVAPEVLVAVPLGLDPAPAVRRVTDARGTSVVVHHRPDLLPPQRFVADHKGDPGWRRSPEQEREWQSLLSRAQLLLGLPGDSGQGLRDALAGGAPVVWAQATAAGAGEQLTRAGLDAAALGPVVVTSAAGLHAEQLAEFALAGILHVAKDVERLQAQKQRREWPARWPMRSLAGSRLLVVGLGGIGRAVAARGAAFGMHVTGVARRPRPAPGVERTEPLERLPDLVADADAVVLTLPGTEQTRGLFDADLLGRMRSDAVLVNVGRGSVVDGDALARVLHAGHLAGAVLDVTDPEPLPDTSALWGAPRLLLSPHTAALSTAEDDRIVAFFAENLGRALDGEPLRNVVDPVAGY